MLRQIVRLTVAALLLAPVRILPAQGAFQAKVGTGFVSPLTDPGMHVTGWS